MPDCETYLELISASLDDALTGAERTLLDAHLAVCPSCRALLDDLTNLRDACDGWGEASPADGFAARVAAAAADEGTTKRIFSFRRYRLLFATAAIAAVVLLAVRTGGFPGLRGAPGATYAPETALSAGTPETDGACAFAAEKKGFVPQPDPNAASEISGMRSGGQMSTEGSEAADELPTENGEKTIFGFSEPSEDTREDGFSSSALILPELPEGDWAWVLILTGDEPEWPVDVEPVSAGELSSAQFYAADAENRAALEDALAAYGCVSCSDEKTVPDAEKGLVCLLAK